MPAVSAKDQRKFALRRDGRYGENAAGKWVRKSAFREIDYDPDSPDKLREFDSFDAAFEFDEKCREDGTGGRKAKFFAEAKDTAPESQRALRRCFHMQSKRAAMRHSAT